MHFQTLSLITLFAALATATPEPAPEPAPAPVPEPARLILSDVDISAPNRDIVETRRFSSPSSGTIITSTDQDTIKVFKPKKFIKKVKVIDQDGDVRTIRTVRERPVLAETILTTEKEVYRPYRAKKFRVKGLGFRHRGYKGFRGDGELSRKERRIRYLLRKYRWDVLLQAIRRSRAREQRFERDLIREARFGLRAPKKVNRWD